MSTRDISWGEVEQAAAIIAREIMKLPQKISSPIRLYGIPRGGLIPAVMVKEALSVLFKQTRKNKRVFITEHADCGDVFIDDILDSGETRLQYEKQFECIPFFALFVKYDHEEWFSFPWERMKNEAGPEENIVRILEYIGEDPNREGLKETPKRVVASWNKIYGGYKQDPSKILKVFKDDSCDEMIVLRDIEFYSTCEHHLLPFSGKAHIGYIPNGQVVGISKLARLLEIFSRRAQIQERIGEQITKALMSTLKPQGCGVVLEAQHSCMTSRGVEKQNSVMVTSSMKGCFMESGVKSEFLRMIGKQ